MKVLIKQATIVSSSSPFNGKTKDILIVDGIISAIEDTISEKADTIIEQQGLHTSIGWMDSFAHFCDPGFEYRETLESGANAAAAGGFTDVIVIPNTNPVTHNKSQVEYIVQKSKTLPVTIHPAGAITKNAEGKELAEMYDMRAAGAIAFTDGINSIQSPGILLKALQYTLAFDGVIIQIPDDKSINAGGLVSEGIVSTQLGLPGKPAIAEELMIARDIELVKYTNSKIHFTGVSTAKGIELIANAKAAGLNVTCSVTPYHLFFSDEDLVTYDTNLKVNPPLRTKADVAALQQALVNGVIDTIASHHIPQNQDNKICEFEYAKNGMIGLESLFGAVISTGSISIEKFVEMITIRSRGIFDLSIPEIKVGAVAKLTLFDPIVEAVFSEPQLRSKSKNAAFIGKKLKGKVIGIINRKSSHIN
ncbi:dihydroorotase [Ferruginibacter albus]|uniref:dihydroorotase n=1 Tax=Ferruginibacter albus TaxID=2875540 RepID=UPI001CC5947B|nr:dihydroorotase [Ferruginibacter albus]UAY53646.1 dihydroorotase [Ferruginibacter albus]